jgi:hypothetical protein
MFGIPLWSALLALTALAILTRETAIMRASAALLANWCVLTLAYQLTGDQYNVPLNMSVDWVTVWVGLLPIRNGWCAMLVLSFGLGMIFHTDHLIKQYGLQLPERGLLAAYWWRFHYLAWGQACLLLGWEIHGGSRALLRRLGSWRRLQALRGRAALARVQVDGD